MEALDQYRLFVIDPLIEVLRMKYGPLHHSFRTRYLHYELPPDVARRLQHLMYVESPQDRRAKYPDAHAWFREVAAELG